MTYDFSLTKQSAVLFFLGWTFIGVLLFFVGWVAGAHWATTDPRWAGVTSGAQTRATELAELDSSTPREPVLDDSQLRQDVVSLAPGAGGANRQVLPAPVAPPLKQPAAKQPGAVGPEAANPESPAAAAPPADEPKIIQEVNPAATEGAGDVTKKPERFLAFTVQVGAFLDPRESSHLIAELEVKGYSPSIFVSHDAQDRQWYSVRIGAYAEKDEAARAAANFTKQEKTKAVVRPLGSL
jgi:septal ring-binding cell division protein DamX